MSSERHRSEPDGRPKSVPKQPGKLAQANARDKRLAEQLRTNLKKRKAQDRARDTEESGR